MENSCKYTARIAQSPCDVRRAQALRAGQFSTDAPNGGLDTDKFDIDCKHVLIEASDTGTLQACFRFVHFSRGGDILGGYSAQYYNLQRLTAYSAPMLEIGRFCLRDGAQDIALLRVAWAFLTRYVDRHNIAFMFGCSSFEGVEQARYTDAFALLKDRYLSPDKWMPQAKATETFDYVAELQACAPCLKTANQNMPPLLRTYLAMGGWVSDHAVIDRAMNTLHVFTGVEVSAIPAPRARLLRADAEAL